MSLLFRHVEKRFDPERPILRGLSAEVPLDQVTFIVGQSGSGKSVLCRLAVGLLRPDAGEVLLEGRAIHQLPERALLKVRREFPYLVQGPALLDWLTVEENVALATPERDLPNARKALERVGLAGLGPRSPSALGPGAKKRVAIARALMLRPRYLLLDEPTTGLDRAAAHQVNDTIRSLKNDGLGALVVSHDYRSLAQMADRVLLVSSGATGFWGTQQEFFQSDDPKVRELTRAASADGQAAS